MEATQHTPGPWCVTPDGYICSERCGFVPFRSPFREDAFRPGENKTIHSDEVLMANARLMAAAPDLLYALELAVRYLEHPDVQAIPFALQASAPVARAHAAIAKATGEETA